MKKKTILRQEAVLPVKDSYSKHWITLSIATLTFLIFFPAVYNGFVNWDDAEAIIENYHLRKLDISFFHWIFTSFHTGNWIPLTWFSFAIDNAIGGLNAEVYHLHNVLLHVLNTLLVFFLSLKIFAIAKKNKNLNFILPSKETFLTPEILTASLTALFFGLHPLRVESVAWVTERKDLLCAFFFFLSLWAYLKYVSFNDQPKSKKYWWISLGLFCLSLASKPMAITLPFIFLLFDFWPLQRFKSHFLQNLLEKIPFFILSLTFIALTIIAQASAGAVSSIERLSLDFRLMNAFHSILFYLSKTFFPFHLVPFYPLGHQSFEPFSLPNVFALLLTFTIAVLCFLYRNSRPYLTIAFLFFLITLLPVLGIVQVGAQAAADRYTYIPSVSIGFLFASALVYIFYSRQTLLAAISIILITSLSLLTIKQIKIWKNSITLWESVVDLYPNQSIVIHTNMANAYKQFKRLDEALREYNRALAFQQPHAYIYDGKGMVLLDKGYTDEAIEMFSQSIALDPSYASPYRNLWFAYDKKGMRELALASILKAVEVNPYFAEAYNNLGISYGYEKRYEESLAAFKKALEINPVDSKLLINIATTYQRLGQLDQAIDLYKKGLTIDANESIYFLNLANTYLLKGMLSEAMETLQAGAKIQPPQAGIFLKLGMLYEQLGEKELAAQHFKKAKTIQNQINL